MRLRIQPAPPCDREAEVSHAARTGVWTRELRSHCEICAECADTSLVSEFLAREPERELTVPEPGLLWWKAEIRRRLEAQDKAITPLRWAEGAVAASVLAGAAYFAAPSLSMEHWSWLAAGILALSLGAAGSWLFLAGARK